METLLDILNKGFDVEIAHQTKRMEVNGVRDFYLRYVWELRLPAARRYAESGERFQSEWEGFATAKECLADLAFRYEIIHAAWMERRIIAEREQEQWKANIEEAQKQGFATLPLTPEGALELLRAKIRNGPTNMVPSNYDFFEQKKPGN